MGTIRYASWNIKQLADRNKDVKGSNAAELIAKTIQAIGADVVAVMEVMLANGRIGMEQIVAGLNKLDGKDPNNSRDRWEAMATSNNGSAKPDRYGIFWKTGRVALAQMTWPDASFNGGTVKFYNRNPGQFVFSLASAPQKQFSALILHAPEPKEQGGKAAVSALQDIANLAVVHKPTISPSLVSGDFNVDYASKPAAYKHFDTLGYTILFEDVATSLSTKISDTGSFTANAYDNIMIQKTVKVTNQGVLDFVQVMATAMSLPAWGGASSAQQTEWRAVLKATRSRVSDHLPIWVEFQL